jgi:amino acid permease
MANKKALFEKFTNDIKRIWRTAPRGLILWNLSLVALLIVPAFYNIEVFLFAQVIGSFLAFAIMLDNDLSNSSSPRNIWVLATAFSWVMFIFMIIFGILQFIYKWTFGHLFEQDEVRRLRVEKEEQEEAKAKQKYQNLLENKNKEKKNQKLLGNEK